MTGNVLVLLCVGVAVVPGVQSACTDIDAYTHLNSFVQHDNCESADMVFNYLHNMTVRTHNVDCTKDIINTLANHYGTHAHTADHCQCSGSFKLQNYSRSSIHDKCMRDQAGYRDLYYQFFTSNHQPRDLVCQTHHLLWTQLHAIQNDYWECQVDIVYHIYSAFSLHDPCTCSEKPVTTTSTPNQHQVQHDCHQYKSYMELDSLVPHNSCMSANTVWHLLDDLEVKDSSCRKDIQNRLTQKYENVPTEKNDFCMCSPKHTLSNKERVRLNNGHHPECIAEHGTTYSDIERDLFTNITANGCRNHNYLWQTLSGVKDHSCGSHCLIDCARDLIIRAAVGYPSQESDSCVCVQCTDINSYNYLNDFIHTDKCESVDLVFKHLHDITEQKGDVTCRRDIINKLASHFGAQIDIPDHCLCTGTFQLQNYSRSNNDGIHGDFADTCLRDHTAYRDVYQYFFPSNNQPHNQICRTHHALWTHLRDIHDDQCQKDIVYHLSYAFSQHDDPCSCSEKPVSTTHSPAQHGQGQQDHCYQYDSYRELDNLMHNKKCTSANTVWHLLDDLQKHNSSCRRHIQDLLSHSYNNVPTDGNDDCVCTPKHTLTNKQQLHNTDNQYTYSGCRDHAPGSTYSVIERDLFTHITHHGCRNHNYLWPTLAGVKNYYSNYSHVWRDCTQDLITRAALDYPQDSDSCVCTSQETTLSPTTTTKSTTHQTTTPATTTKHSDVTTTSHENHVTTTHSPVQHGQGHDHCDQFNSYKELARLVNNSQCLSANTVWHLLDDLQVHDSGCRTHIQNILSYSYKNIPTDGNDECVCNQKHTLTNKQHLHYTNAKWDGYIYQSCSHEAGSTYNTIKRDLFTNITDRGCRNHNYLWPTLAGVKDYYSNHSHGWHDCTQDLITRAAMDYPSQDSDNCTCVQKTITPSMSPTTTTTSTTQQTTTPTTTTTTTTKSHVTTSSHGSIVVTQTTDSSHIENGWESWSPWQCKITKSDLSANCHSYRQRPCLSNMATDCEGSSFETVDCNDSQCSDADITYVNCSFYNRDSACEDQTLCTHFSNTPWHICGDAAHVAKCPRLCTCCPTTTTLTTTTTSVAKPAAATTTLASTPTTMTPSNPTTSSSISYAKCNFDCGLHGRCYEDGCRCSPGYHGDRCEQLEAATTISPTTTATQTTTPPPKPTAMTTTLSPPSTTITTPTTSSTTKIITVQATATTPPGTTETIKAQQITDPIVSTTVQQPSTSLRQCNHTCTLDAVILSMAVKTSKAGICPDKTSELASNEALPMDCCNMGDHNSWIKGDQVQNGQVCKDGTPPPYTPIAAFNETGLIPDTAGIFYGCIKDGQSGFMMIHQTCELLPHLLHVDGTKGKDPNAYFMFH